MTALQELTELSGTLHNPEIQKWKEQGKKVVGFMCSYVPEEILYAADILPCRIRASGCQQTASADVYMSHLNCTFVRSCLQYMLEDKYDILDGLVMTNSCDHVRRLYDVLREIKPTAFPFLEFVSIPRTVNDEAIAFYKEEMIQFRAKVERFFGVQITDASLRKAIETYNDTRHLLRRLYELRQGNNPPLTGAETLSVILAGTTIPKDQYNQLLRSLLEELGQRKGTSDYRARLMIAGSGGFDDPAYLATIEGLGGLVVTDTLCFGSRYFWEPVQIGDDLMLSLAESYLKRPSCAFSVDTVAERSLFMKQMIEDFRVNGVVYQRMRYCDLWGGQLLDVRRKLMEAGTPLLDLEREYVSNGGGQLVTRVQAFLETIER